MSSSPREGDDGGGLAPGRVHSGLRWTALSLVALRLGRLLTTVVLARLLTEEMFGVVTLALAFIMAFQALRDIGFGHAYVQRKDQGPDDDRRAASTVFWVAAALNVVMFGVGWVTAPAAAAAFPKLTGLEPVLRATFCLLLIEALSTTPTAVLQKRLEFGRIAAGEMVGVGANAVLSIGLALAGAGEWSLVLGTLGARLCQTLTVVAFARWRPTLEFDAAVARELFGFGKYLWGTSLLAASNKIVDKLLLGRIAGDAALGVYGNSYNLCTTVSKPLYSIVLRVAFPTMSRIQDDAAALRAGFLRAASGIGLLAVPLAVGLALTADDFVVTVYGARWAPMGPLVEVLAFYGFVMSMAAVTGPVLMATGRPRALFLFTLAGQALLVTLLLLFARAGADEVRGGVRIAWALLASAALSEGAAFLWASARLGLRPVEAAAPLARSFLAAALMGLVVVAIQAGCGTDMHAALRLVLAVAGGVAAYAAAAAAVNRRALTESLAELRRVAGAR